MRNATKLIKAAIRYNQDGEYSKAAEAYRRALEAHPQEDKVHCDSLAGLTMALMSQQEYTAAKAYADRLFKLASRIGLDNHVDAAMRLLVTITEAAPEAKQPWDDCRHGGPPADPSVMGPLAAMVQQSKMRTIAAPCLEHARLMEPLLRQFSGAVDQAGGVLAAMATDAFIANDHAHARMFATYACLFDAAASVGVAALFQEISKTEEHAERRQGMLERLTDEACSICLEELAGTEAPLQSIACGACGSMDQLLRCKCKLKYFCSKACQKRSWKEHKADCKSWVQKDHKVVSLPCGHRLHQHCLDQLHISANEGSMRVRCPLCRRSLSPILNQVRTRLAQIASGIEGLFGLLSSLTGCSCLRDARAAGYGLQPAPAIQQWPEQMPTTGQAQLMGRKLAELGAELVQNSPGAPFKPGDDVMLEGLKAARYNGQNAYIVKLAQQSPVERWGVELESGEEISVKASNLQIAQSALHSQYCQYINEQFYKLGTGQNNCKLQELERHEALAVQAALLTAGGHADTIVEKLREMVSSIERMEEADVLELDDWHTTVAGALEVLQVLSDCGSQLCREVAINGGFEILCQLLDCDELHTVVWHALLKALCFMTVKLEFGVWVSRLPAELIQAIDRRLLEEVKCSPTEVAYFDVMGMLVASLATASAQLADMIRLTQITTCLGIVLVQHTHALQHENGSGQTNRHHTNISLEALYALSLRYDVARVTQIPQCDDGGHLAGYESLKDSLDDTEFSYGAFLHGFVNYQFGGKMSQAYVAKLLQEGQWPGDQERVETNHEQMRRFSLHYEAEHGLNR